MYKLIFSLMNLKCDKVVTIEICELNKLKEEIRIKLNLIEEMLQVNKRKFLENFKGILNL